MAGLKAHVHHAITIYVVCCSRSDGPGDRGGAPPPIPEACLSYFFNDAATGLTAWPSRPCQERWPGPVRHAVPTPTTHDAAVSRTGRRSPRRAFAAAVRCVPERVQVKAPSLQCTVVSRSSCLLEGRVALRGRAGLRVLARVCGAGEACAATPSSQLAVRGAPRGPTALLPIHPAPFIPTSIPASAGCRGGPAAHPDGG